MHEVALGAIAGVGHQVDLGEAGDLDIPAVGLQRNLVLEQHPRARAAVLPFAALTLEGAQTAPI